MNKTILIAVFTGLLFFTSCNGLQDSKTESVLSNEFLLGKWNIKEPIDIDGKASYTKYEVEFTEKKAYWNLEYSYLGNNVLNGSTDYTIDGNKVVFKEGDGSYFTLLVDGTLYSKLVLFDKSIELKLYKQ